jgi:hypothetical protein
VKAMAAGVRVTKARRPYCRPQRDTEPQRDTCS